MVTYSVQKPIKCLLFDMDIITVVKRFWIIEKFNSAEISLILCPIRLSIFKMIYHLWNQNLNWKLHDAQGDVGWYELGYGIEGSTKNENLVQSVGIATFVIVLWVARKTAHVFPAPKFFSITLHMIINQQNWCKYTKEHPIFHSNHQPWLTIFVQTLNW
jgi:hypothetical protein